MGQADMCNVKDSTSVVSSQRDSPESNQKETSDNSDKGLSTK